MSRTAACYRSVPTGAQALSACLLEDAQSSVSFQVSHPDVLEPLDLMLTQLGHQRVGGKQLTIQGRLKRRAVLHEFERRRIEPWSQGRIFPGEPVQDLFPTDNGEDEDDSFGDGRIILS